jgi:hypothetical protein
MKPALLLGSLLLLQGCATVYGFSNIWSIPGDTIVTPELRDETLRAMQKNENTQAPNCLLRKITDTKVTVRPSKIRIENDVLLEGKWTELWTLDRCGKTIVYKHHYAADGKGATSIKTTVEK